MEQPAPSPPVPLRGDRAGSGHCENMVLGVLVPKCHRGVRHNIYTGENHRRVCD